MFAASKKKIADQGPAPDNEDVVEVSDMVCIMVLYLLVLFFEYGV
jgi:hypothetical protein